MGNWTKNDDELLNNTDFTKLSWEEIKDMFSDIGERQLMKKMHDAGKTKIKKGNVYWYENKPSCVVTHTNEPNMELMARAFLNLYYATKDDPINTDDKKK
ncbi:hypothetical protein [Bacillus sp. JJ1474]|uniref:hypothetical protein n=1 Tax=Bacillus sp. JJ1474 TaxID=3122955 RepID=UPI002FFDD454